MIGDGINDAPAFLAAYCAGTPAVDRPALPARADFYFLGSGLGPLCETLDMAKTTRRAVVRCLVLAGSYNVFVVTQALLGRISPLWCALAMPLSSVLILLVTASVFRREPGTTSAAGACAPLATLEGALAAGDGAMNALFLTLFVSIILALGGVLLFAFAFKQRDHEHVDRLSLLPLHDDVPAQRKSEP